MGDTYSVWNWEKGRYDYYQSRERLPYRARLGNPALSGNKAVGGVPEESVHPLPSTARYVGDGEEAVGIVASPQQRSGLVFVALVLLGLWIVK
jgi:hypothetical protein